MAGGQPVYAVDASVWPRGCAETSPGRGICYHPSRHSVGQPVVAGWHYSWVAQVNFVRDSWTAPVDVRRLRPLENANAAAAGQIRALLDRLAAGAAPPPTPGGAAVPLFVFDAGYDPTHLQVDL